jgi:hypothetical protein
MLRVEKGKFRYVASVAPSSDPKEAGEGKR